MKIFGIGLLLLAAAGTAQAHDEGAVNCTNCAEWNQPQAPFNIYGNSWYVGTGGLSSVLITSPQGHILLDGALPQSAAQIERKRDINHTGSHTAARVLGRIG